MKYLPNTITFLRILITPVVLVLLLTDTFIGHVWALILFIVASISDYLDGKLARTLEVPSRLGRFLDPLADKILVLGTFVVLAFIRPANVPWWAVGLIAFRDVMVTGLRSWQESQGRSIRTLKSAKAKTTVQLTFLIAYLVVLVAARLPGIVGRAGNWILDGYIPLALLVVVVLITLYSGFAYARGMQYATSDKD